MIETAKKILSMMKLPCDIYCNRAKTLGIDICDGEIENFDITEAQGLGLRVFSAQRVGFAYTTSLDRRSIDALIRKATDNALFAEKDSFRRLPVIRAGARYGEEGSFRIYDERIPAVPSGDKVDALRDMEKRALAYDKRIKKVVRASYSDSEYEVAILNSAGFEKSSRGTVCSAGINVIAGDDKEIQMGWDSSSRRHFDELSFRDTAHVACLRAVSLLGGKRVESRRLPALLDPLVTCEFLNIIGDSLCADSVQKGKSLFRGMLGKKVASPLVNIVDDGTLAGGVATSPFDGEGNPTQRTVLVKDGILENFLYDDYTANKDNVVSTGNAVRSYGSLPEVGASNLFMAAGNKKKNELAGEVKTGVYIFETMGMHTVNIVSGEFSVGINGLWIEGGKYSYPLHGLTAAGNIFDLLDSIDCVGDDLKFYGGTGAPSVIVRDLMVGGR